MLITHTKSMASILLKMIVQTPSKNIFRKPLTTFIGYRMSKWDKQNITKKLDKEIIDSHSKIIYSDPQNESYFHNQKWSIHYNEQKTEFQYRKEDNSYDVRVLTHVKENPPNQPDQQIQEVEDEKQSKTKKLNYSQVVIFIKKKEQQKWLAAEMAVIQGSVELLGVFFTKYPSFVWQKHTYPGPELSTLPQQILSIINQLLLSVGLDTQILMNMVIHSASKVDQLDLKWLKDLREIWG